MSTTGRSPANATSAGPVRVTSYDPSVWTNPTTNSSPPAVRTRTGDTAPSAASKGPLKVVFYTVFASGEPWDRYQGFWTNFTKENPNLEVEMRPAAIDDYKRWITETAVQFKRTAPNQLVSIGHEGWIGSEGMEVYEQIHADPNIDYLTIHIWPKNWAWFANGRMAEEYDKFRGETVRRLECRAACRTLARMAPRRFEMRARVIGERTGIDEPENVRAGHVVFSSRRSRRWRRARKSSVLIVPVVTPSARAMSPTAISSR